MCYKETEIPTHVGASKYVTQFRQSLKRNCIQFAKLEETQAGESYAFVVR